MLRSVQSSRFFLLAASLSLLVSFAMWWAYSKTYASRLLYLPAIDAKRSVAPVRRDALIEEFRTVAAKASSTTKQFARERLEQWKEAVLKRADTNFQRGLVGWLDLRRLDVSAIWTSVTDSPEKAEIEFTNEISRRLLDAIGGADLLQTELEQIAAAVIETYRKAMADGVSGVKLLYAASNVDIAPFVDTLSVRNRRADGSSSPISWRELMAVVPPEARTVVGAAGIYGVSYGILHLLGQNYIAQYKVAGIAQSAGLGQLCGPQTVAKCQRFAQGSISYLRGAVKWVGMRPAAVAAYATPVAIAVAAAFVAYSEYSSFSSRRTDLIRQHLAIGFTKQIEDLLKDDGLYGHTLRELTRQVIDFV